MTKLTFKSHLPDSNRIEGGVSLPLAARSFDGAFFSQEKDDGGGDEEENEELKTSVEGTLMGSAGMGNGSSAPLPRCVGFE